MDSSKLLTAKHGFVIGIGGSGKSDFVRNLIKENSQKCIYISIHNEDFGDIPCITIKEPSSEIKNLEVLKISQYITNNESFVIKIASGYVGQMLASEYLNDVVLEILKWNKSFTLVIDDTIFIAGQFQETYKKLLTQKEFSVISIFQNINPEIKYIFDYAEQIYLFKLSPTDFESFEEKGFLSKDDLKVFDQKVGEYIVR